MEKNVGLNRFASALPKVGIRPIIDGRRNGVRESLEDQTMGLAKRVKALIESNCFHNNGAKVECVISPTTIGGVAEAAECAEYFRKENVGLSISVTPCWCYGSETMDMDPLIPKAVFGFNGTERPGAVYLAAVLAAHNQKGLPAFGIYGRDVQDASSEVIPDDVQEKILRFVRAGLAVATMRGKAYVSIGTVSMGIAGSIVNDGFFQKYLGMRNEYVDSSEMIRRMNLGIYDKAQFEKALKWVKENCKEAKDLNPEKNQRSRELKDKDWETCVKMALIAKDIMQANPVLAEMGFKEEAQGRNAILSGFQGQRQWTDFMPNGDFMEAILNSSFDWNGTRAPYLMATENDSLNGVAMLFGHLLTNTGQVFADVRTYWSPEAFERVTGKKLTGLAENGIIHLINSGSASLDGTGKLKKDGKPVMKPFWEISEKEFKDCMNATEFVPATTEYFRGGGFSSRFITEGGMPITLTRINIVYGLGPVLQLAEGYSVEIDPDSHKKILDRTDPGWPTTWFAPKLTNKGAFKSVYSVMNNCGANHGAFSYGHIGADLITLASMLRIPVSMHNVDPEKLFRPSAWSAFGTKDVEGADYRACKNFGPLY